jgi:hypothetical protein
MVARSGEPGIVMGRASRAMVRTSTLSDAGSTRTEYDSSC